MPATRRIIAPPPTVLFMTRSFPREAILPSILQGRIPTGRAGASGEFADLHRAAGPGLDAQLVIAQHLHAEQRLVPNGRDKDRPVRAIPEEFSLVDAVLARRPVRQEA